jgi:hypothetical protein
MANGNPRQGFELRHDATAVFAWGEDLPQAFEAALTGMMHAAGAPADLAMSGKTMPINATGASPADLLDNLGLALFQARRAHEPLDGSFQMGEVIRTDEGWSGWGSAGLGDGAGEPLDEFQILMPPKVERKIGRVTVKMQIAILTKKAAESLKEFERLLRQIHPGGVVGPGDFTLEEDDEFDE